MYLPTEIKKFIGECNIENYSTSKNAETFYIKKEDGYFLKIADKDTLQKEAKKTKILYKYGLSANFEVYISGEKDYLITKKIQGESGISKKYLQDPTKLVKIYATTLRKFHEIKTNEIKENTVEPLIEKAILNPNADGYTYLLKEVNISSIKEAIEEIKRLKNKVKYNVLVHGDYCLPNIILDDWKVSGIIDVGETGVGDRHFDIFWALWSLNYNLKTKKYNDLFLDTYGRDLIDLDVLKLMTLINALL